MPTPLLHLGLTVHLLLLVTLILLQVAIPILLLATGRQVMEHLTLILHHRMVHLLTAHQIHIHHQPMERQLNIQHRRSKVLKPKATSLIGLDNYLEGNILYITPLLLK